MKYLAPTAILLAFAALFRPAVDVPRTCGAVIVVADRSASLSAREREAQASLVAAIEAARPDGVELGVVSFGETAVAEHAPQRAPFPGFRAAPGENGSDLNAALDAALSLVPEGVPARLLVLSDGKATGTDPRGETAALAAKRSIPIDHRLFGERRADPIAITGVEAPSLLSAGEPMLAFARVRVEGGPRRVQYSLKRGGVTIASGEAALPDGISRIPFRDASDGDSVSVYSLALRETGGGDAGTPENDEAGFIVTRTGERPLLLFPASKKSRLPEILRGQGVKVRVAEPDEIDFSPAGLSAFSGVWIENRRADDFGRVPLENLARWVEDAGGGLVLSGGRNSFGIGGYFKSPLERILPVTLERRNEHRKFKVAVAVALDRSGSMSAPAAGTNRPKMDMADIAAAGVLDVLGDDDSAAVFAVDTEAHAVLPLMNADAARDRKGDVLRIRSEGGGIYVDEALRAMFGALARSDAQVRHAILFADAADSEHPGDYKKLIETAKNAGVTISVVGLGWLYDCDAHLLQEIADLGEGQCFFSEDPMEIPRLFAQDTMLYARELMRTNPVVPRLTSALPLVFPNGLPQDAGAPPAVGGYNVAYLHPAATPVALAPVPDSPDEPPEPVLAIRPIGAGRTLAFTGEADGELSGPFARWPGAGPWFGALARHALGETSDAAAGLILRTSLENGGMRIDAYIDPDAAVSPAAAAAMLASSLPLRVLRSAPAAETRAEAASLDRVAPDRFTCFVPLHGAETVLPVLSLPGEGTNRTAHPLPPARLPYSPEFAPDDGADGAALLEDISKATGGKRLADPAAIWKNIRRGTRRFCLSPVLFLLSAALLLFDVFAKRLGLFAGRTKRNDAAAESAKPKAESKKRQVPASSKPRPRTSSTDSQTQAEEPRVSAPEPESPRDSGAGSTFAEAKRRARRR